MTDEEGDDKAGDEAGDEAEALKESGSGRGKRARRVPGAGKRV